MAMIGHYLLLEEILGHTKDGNSHVVWFEDADSVVAKLNLINKYNLVGASYWNITKDFPQNWLVLISLYKVVKLL